VSRTFDHEALELANNKGNPSQQSKPRLPSPGARRSPLLFWLFFRNVRMSRTVSRRRSERRTLSPLRPAPLSLRDAAIVLWIVAASSWSSSSSPRRHGGGSSRGSSCRIRPGGDAGAGTAHPWVAMAYASYSWSAAHASRPSGWGRRQRHEGRCGADAAPPSSSSFSGGLPGRDNYLPDDNDDKRGCSRYRRQATTTSSSILRAARRRDDGADGETTTTTSSSSQGPVHGTATARHDDEAVAARNWWDRDALLECAQTQGVELSLTTLGPAYRGVARSAHNRTQILAYVEGFVRPQAPPLLHLDKMEVFRPLVKQARQENPRFTGGGTSLGVGLLVAYLCVLHGLDQNCQMAEFLAIDDSDFQHRRLVKLYKQSGFDVVKYVGDDWRDIPDRMVWGGCGTLLRKDVPYLLAFWTALLEKGKTRQLEKLTKSTTDTSCEK
jgi:hypothetical protein